MQLQEISSEGLLWITLGIMTLFENQLTDNSTKYL